MPLPRPTRNTKLTPNGTKKSRGWIGRLLSRASSVGVSNVQVFRPERLEERRLLTTLNDVGTGQPATQFFYSGQAQICAITYFDVNFEAVGVAVDPTSGATALGDLIPPSNPEPAIGANLYKIYVTQSSPDSYISVYQVDPATGTPTPFAGAVTPFVIATTTGAQGLATAPAGTGAVLIGALDPASVPGPTPIASVPMNAPIGLQPVPASGNLTPGIEVIPVNSATGAQNDIGEVQIGGMLTGAATFGGNVGTFYAGAVLTGDINGDPLPPQGAPTSVRVSPDNFHVAGDLRAFLTTGPVGTDGTGTAAAPTYITNFDLSVGGKLGEIKVGNSEKGQTGAAFAGTIEVGNSPYISQQTPYPTAAPTGSVNVIGNTAAQTEIESLATPDPDAVWATGTLDLRNDTPADAEFLDTFPVINTATNLPVRDAHGKVEFEASVSGNVDTANGDVTDYYAAGLLAGQTIQVSISAGTVQVLDPDGRTIASNSIAGAGVFQITTDRPGIYHFAVTPGGTYTLNVVGIPEQGIGAIATGSWFNDVGIDSGIIVGNGDLGAIQVVGTYFSSTTGPTPVTTGSTLPGTVTPPVFASTSINVVNGNLNALVGGTLGVESANLVIANGPFLSVANGSVGLVQSTTGELNLETQFDPNFLNAKTAIHKTDDAYATAIGGSIQVIDAAASFQGDLAVNGGIGTIRAADMATNTASYIDVNADNKGSDGIIDLIDAATLGTAQAGGPDIVTNEGGDVRYLNATAAFRPLLFGGGADLPVTYNAGQAATITDSSGNTITATPIGLITTTVVTTTNTPAANSSIGTATTTTSTATTGPQITVFSYPVLDRGGVIPISISSSGGMSITDSGPKGSEVNIANLSISGVGSPIVNSGVDAYGNTTIEQTPPTINASTGTTTTTTTTTNTDGSTTTVTTNVSGGGTSTFLDLTIGGPEVVNVLQITGTCNVGDVLGGVTSIINNTLGEVGSITIQTALPEAANLPANVGTILVHGNLGFTTPRATPAVDVPRAVIADGNMYPFVQQHTGVVVGNFLTHQGSAVNIDAYGAIANVLVLSTIQSLVPNYAVTERLPGAAPIPGQLDGLDGPIVVGELAPVTAPVPTFGTLIYADIGQGIPYSGSGTVGASGIYASGAIGVINNAGNSGASIRGNVLSEDDTHVAAGGAYTVGNAIGLIQLTNGSIIGAEIATIVNVATTTPTFFDNFLSANTVGGTGFTSPDPGEAPFASSYVYEIGSIVVSGKAGILGATIDCTNVGPIVVNNGGFGVLSTTITSEALGRVAGITASGYGLRNDTVTDGGYVGQIVASGGGPTISVLAYPLDVRESDLPLSGTAAAAGFVQVDPFFDSPSVATIDLNAALGTTAQQPNIAGVTDTGVVQDCVFKGQESFAGLVAQKVRTAETLYSGSAEPTPPIANIPYEGTDFPMEINFAMGVGPILIFQETDGLEITTGHLIGFHPYTSVTRVGISVAGVINSLRINGNFGQIITDPQTGQQMPDSYIHADGPSGTIGSLYVTGSLNGTVSATGTIGSIFVGHDVEAGIIALGQTTGLALGSLHVQGGVRDGALTLNGSVGSIVINGTLGTSTASLIILGNANLISVGANHKIKNSDLALHVSVGGFLRNLTVYGTISGSVSTGGDLTNLRVTGSGAATVLLTGSISVGGKIQNATFTGGSIGGSVIAANSIGNFTINNGSLLVPAVVESQIAGIGFFRITGGLAYGLYGSLLAQSGLNDRIDISGNLGDGVNTATVTALTGSTFRIRGTVATNANVQVAGQLNLLEVDGNIETGAVIAAHPLLKQKIKGSDTGSITIV